MFKRLFVYLFLIISLLNPSVNAECTSGEYAATLAMTYTSSANQQSFDIWKDAYTTGSIIFSLEGTTADNNNVRYYDLCLSSSNYVVHMKDSGGNGWGNGVSFSYMTIYYRGIIVFRGGFEYVAGNTYKEKFDSFKQNNKNSSYIYICIASFIIPFGSIWKYSDTIQSGSGWQLTNYIDSNWSTANSNLFPAFSSNIRYYRYTLNYGDKTQVGTYIISIKTNLGIIVYIQGTKLYEFNLPSGTITSSSNALSKEQTDYYRTMTVPRSLIMDSTSITISIEIHREVNPADSNDIFDCGASILSVNPNENSKQRLIDGTVLSSPEGLNANFYGSKIFDENTLSYYYTTQTDHPAIIYSLPNHSCEWVNGYSISTALITTYGDPTGWKISAANYMDPNINPTTSSSTTTTTTTTWIELDTKDYINWEGRKEYKYMSLRSNQQCYMAFKLEILGSTVANRISLSTFTPYISNINEIPTGLQYESSTITAYKDITAVSIYPISSGYTSYSITPSLPAGLTFSPFSGSITGITSTDHSGSYTITATNIINQQTSTFILNLIITVCSPPTNIALRLRKINKLRAFDESYTIYNTNNELVYASTYFLNNIDHTTYLCLPASTYKFIVFDIYGDGWADGSMLYIDYSTGEGDWYTAGKIYDYQSGDRTYYFNMNYLISPQSTSWTYIQGNIPVNWNNIADPSGFSSFPIVSRPTSTSPIWLFRHTFNMNTKQDYTSFELRIKTRSGYVVFINGIEVFLYKLSSSTITLNSIPINTETTSTYRTITGSLNYLELSTNTIAIGIVNSMNNNPSTIDFDASFQLIRSYGQIGRSWDITSTSSPVTDTLIHLFDLSTSTDALFTTIGKGSASILINYGLHRAEFINKYCFTSSSLISSYDPSDWQIFGSMDGTQFTSLGSVTNAYFSSRKQERCFYLPNNNHSWTIYKFEITEPASTLISNYQYSLSQLSLITVDISSLVPPIFNFNPNTIQGYINVPFPDVTPSSSLYGNYRITPSLPSPLELDTSTGSIRGIPTISMSPTIYTITATSPQGIDSTTTLTVSVTSCISPNIMFSLLIKSGNAGDEMGFTLRNKENSTLYTKNGFTNNQENYYPFCVPYGLYTLDLTDSGHNGWDIGYFRVLLEDSTSILQGSLGENESSKSFPLSIGYVITPIHSEWKYYNNGIQPSNGWTNLLFDDSHWMTATPLTFGSTNGNTVYFRHLFTLDNINTYASLSFNIKSRYGFVVYINGEEQYRNNMPEGIIQYNTVIPSILEESDYYGTSIPISFSNIIKGDNVIAIEVHYNKDTNYIVKDVEFDANVLLVADNSYRIIDGIGSSDLSTDTTISNVFDNIKGSIYVSPSRCEGTTIIWTYNKNRKEYISSYSIITGPNCNSRHPSGWIIQGSNDNINWSTLSIQSGQNTQYSTEYIYDFYNKQVYNQYRMKVTECNNRPIQSENMNLELNCETITGIQGFQLAELGLYAKQITLSCSSIDGFDGAIEGQYAYKNCPTYYEGRIEALCTQGILGQPISYCVPQIPLNIIYPQKSIVLHIGESIEYIPIIQAVNYTMSISPSLPTGLIFDTMTGTISGISNTIYNSTIYTITCTNNAGSISTEIYIQCIQRDSLPLWAWIVIILLSLLIICTIVFCICIRMKSRNKKSHINIEKTKQIKNKEKGKKQIAKI
ncbi:hypothetical protein WA158_004683 [Blastocystis sp. Blastoise]